MAGERNACARLPRKILQQRRKKTQWVRASRPGQDRLRESPPGRGELRSLSLQDVATAYIHIRREHLAVDPRRMRVARGRIIRHEPIARILRLGHGEEACVAVRALEAPDQRKGLLAETALLVRRAEAVDRRALRQQRVEQQVEDALHLEGEPSGRRRVALAGEAREEQEISLDAEEARRVKALGQRRAQGGPSAEVALRGAEDLCAEACAVAIFVATNGHEVPRGREGKRDLADAADVHLALLPHGIPDNPIGRLFEEHAALGARAVMVPDVADLVHQRVANFGLVNLHVPDDLGLPPKVHGLLPHMQILRAGPLHAPRREAPLERFQPREEQEHLALELEEDHLAQVVFAGVVLPCDLPILEILRRGRRDVEPGERRREVAVGFAIGDD
mmetsp:Transcript_94929/g.186245  ORF Transcript_94929/g.186245 Transcript_94929/m.186245 type:complete len:391 (+) Transcript_94929:177-1349(+)